MTDTQEQPTECIEIPGFILVVSPGGRWLTSDGDITEDFSKRGVWETAEAAEQAKERFLGNKHPEFQAEA